MTPSEAIRNADAAIVGQLVKVVPRGAGRADFRYRVHGVYKGRRTIELGTTISVRSANQSAACGLPQGTGQRHGLLLASGEDGQWLGGLCGLIEPRKLRAAAGQGDAVRQRSRSGGDPDCAI